jgi:hypothetical protein
MGKTQTNVSDARMGSPLRSYGPGSGTAGETLIRTDVAEELSFSGIRVTRRGATFLLTSVPTRATRRNIPEDGILQWLWIS